MKTDITISKSMTLNMGNYSNVKPEISVTLKDVSLENYEKAYKTLSHLVEDMFALELRSNLDTMLSANEFKSKKDLLNRIESMESNIESSIADNLKALQELA